MKVRVQFIGRTAALLCGAALLAACANEDIILEGERLDVRAPLGGEVLAPDSSGVVDRRFEMPAMTPVSNWTHGLGNATNSVANPAFTASPTLAWSVDIGEGNTRKHRITSEPVIAGGRIFTLDSQSKVTAVSTAGEVVWTRDPHRCSNYRH